MRVQLKTSTCKHCGRKIRHLAGDLWIDDTETHEQYCMMDPVHGSRLHQPKQSFTILNLKGKT